MRSDWLEASRRQKGLATALGVLALLVLAGVLLLWARWDYVRPVQDLYRSARAAAPQKAAVQYRRLGERLPQIEEYAELWAAEAAMPSMEALRTLHEVAAFRPQSPAAYEAHVAMARYYAGSDAPQAQDEYAAALTLNDTAALRLELARYLEKKGDDAGAYDQYLSALSKEPDAFEGMRRTGHDPLAVAKDLIAAGYDKDALDTLRTIGDPQAWPLRAQALADAGRSAEAEDAYTRTLQQAPGDATALIGLAGVEVQLGQVEKALADYQAVDTDQSRLAQADLLADSKPADALALYEKSPYPVAWWSATAILEAQKRLTETLPLYARVAASDSSFADDAAYRLYVLGQRLGDQKAAAQGKALLDGMGLDWLALRVGQGQPNLDPAPDPLPGGQDILGKAQLLASLGRDDLAHLELLLAARLQSAPEVKLAAAQALAGQGDVLDAQAVAAAYIAGHPHAPLAFWQLSYPRAYSATVQAAARQYQVDPLLIWSVMREESNYDPAALSYAGARGLMQIMPDTQTWIAGQLNADIPPGAAFTPETSIQMGAWYLGYLMQHFKGDQELAIAAYDGGPASVESWLQDRLVSNRDDWLRWIGFGQTREYLEQVSLNYQVYQVLYETGK
jgi:soluble lytic murein transglycosylase